MSCKNGSSWGICSSLWRERDSFCVQSLRKVSVRRRAYVVRYSIARPDHLLLIVVAQLRPQYAARLRAYDNLTKHVCPTMQWLCALRRSATLELDSQCRKTVLISCKALHFGTVKV